MEIAGSLPPCPIVFLKKQPVLTTFSAVHVVSFWHLKTHPKQSKRTLPFACSTWSWFRPRVHTLGFHFTHTATAAHNSAQCNHARKQHRHSIAGVLPIPRTQSDHLPPPANGNQDQSQLALRKAMADGPAQPEGGEQKGRAQRAQREYPYPIPVESSHLWFLEIVWWKCLSPL